jgi:hypothetical protein
VAAVKGGPRLQGIEVVARAARLLIWKDVIFPDLPSRRYNPRFDTLQPRPSLPIDTLQRQRPRCRSPGTRNHTLSIWGEYPPWPLSREARGCKVWSSWLVGRDGRPGKMPLSNSGRQAQEAILSYIPYSPGPPFPFTGFTDSGHDIGVQARKHMTEYTGGLPPVAAVKGGPRLQSIELVPHGAGLLT